MFSQYLSPLDIVNVFRFANKEPYLHQLDMVSDLILMDKPKILLADDVGLGKTVQTLAYLKLALDSGFIMRVLLIVPAAILDQWLEEMLSFDFPEDIFYIIEIPRVPRGYQVYLITMDRAKKDEYLEELGKVKWDLIVVDEAHKLRIGRLRARLASLIEDAERKLLLTATPHTGDEKSYELLRSLVNHMVRREKRDLKSYEGREVLPEIVYWIVRVSASREEAEALHRILVKLRQMDVKPIARYVVLRRALSSPLSFLATLRKVVKGAHKRRSEELEEEPDSYLLHAKGILSDFKVFTESDRKLEVLKSLLEERLKDRKVLVFTEYATTAEYLFEKLNSTFNCNVTEKGDGYAIAESLNRNIMYVTSKARSRIDINQQVKTFAAKENAILISTDVFSEGINLQMFDAVVNYEVIWSPTRHMQRIGRIWRFGQKSSEVLVVDIALDTRSRESEFAMYCEYLEKILNVSLHGLTPQNYAGYVVYGSTGSTLSKLFELSGFEVDVEEVFSSIYERKVEELRRKLERLIEIREKVRNAKPVETVKKDLKLKLGYPPERFPEAGSNYVMVEIVFTIGRGNFLEERLLVEIPQGRAKLMGARIYRLLECECAEITEIGGEVTPAEKPEVEATIAKVLTEPLRIYIKNLGAKAFARVLELRPVIVKSVYSFDSFEASIREEIRRSRGRMNVEMLAVKNIKDYLKRQGYAIVEDYYSGPRAFDMVVERGGKKYTVECKGRFLRVGEQPSIILTANEMEWGNRVNVESYTFKKFLDHWEIRRKRSYYDYVIEAEKKNAGLVL